MTFEPTQPQDGVDPNMFTLIDPGAIPYPLTDTWSLNYAAETLRTGGENLFGGAEDMHATWGGLQAHYVAPESETLFAAMNPVVTRGEDIQSDLATVAGALQELADAAATARSSLNTLKIEAQSFWNKHHDKKVWWLDKDDETDEWAIQENIRLKDGVNTAWATFNEAENACATRISTLFGGPSYASPDQAGGDDVLVYGLPTDAGEREAPGFDETLMDPANDFTAWLGTEFHPSMASFSNSTDQAAWDNIVVDGLVGVRGGAGRAVRCMAPPGRVADHPQRALGEREEHRQRRVDGRDDLHRHPRRPRVGRRGRRGHSVGSLDHQHRRQLGRGGGGPHRLVGAGGGPRVHRCHEHHQHGSDDRWVADQGGHDRADPGPGRRRALTLVPERLLLRRVRPELRTWRA